MKPEQRAHVRFEHGPQPVAPLDVEQFMARHGALRVVRQFVEAPRQQDNRTPHSKRHRLLDIVRPAKLRAGRQRDPHLVDVRLEGCRRASLSHLPHAICACEQPGESRDRSARPDPQNDRSHGRKRLRDCLNRSVLCGKHAEGHRCGSRVRTAGRDRWKREAEDSDRAPVAQAHRRPRPAQKRLRHRGSGHDEQDLAAVDHERQ